MNPHLVAAELELADGTDPRAVGGAVTVALCGHWEHPPPCFWPHHTAIDPSGRVAVVFACDDDEEAGVRARIESVLRGGDGWSLVRLADRTMTPDERALGERLATGPRAEAPLV